MNWIEISANVSPELVEPVVNLFEHYSNEFVVIETSGGFNPDEGEEYPASDLAKVSVYIFNDELAADRCAAINGGLRLLKIIKPLEIMPLKTILQEDWENNWKDHFYALDVGNRIIIKPPWVQQEIFSGAVVINLNPGMAFGTGHHPTTRMCLELIENYLRVDFRVLDLGSGSGILSFAASGLGASYVIGIDTDNVATQSAIKGIELNPDLNFKGEFLNTTIPDERLKGMDLTLANISANYFIDNCSDIFQTLKKGGVLIASGFLKDNENLVISNLTNSGFSIIENLLRDDWCAVVMVKN